MDRAVRSERHKPTVWTMRCCVEVLLIIHILNERL